MASEHRRTSSACQRNAEPIFEVLQRVLPEGFAGVVLEVAAGTGMHGAHFAPKLPDLTWQPTDMDPRALASIDAWRTQARAPNLLAPLVLDARDPRWPVDRADVVFCANMVHIADWSCTVGLCRGAGRVLPEDGLLVVYGPFSRGGTMAPSNQEFDEMLRARNPAWGVRELEAVAAEARDAGLALQQVVDMPANNVTAVFRREGSA